jgi:tRNA (uracil-5-)-methyltransferase
MPRPRTQIAQTVGNVKWSDGSVSDVLHFDVASLLKEHAATAGSEVEKQPLPPRLSELEVKILKLSSTGDGLGLSPDGHHVYVVPFTVPGDTVIAKPHIQEKLHSLADLVRVVEPSENRHDSAVKCQYFTKCGGCQFQMMLPDYQLNHKRNIVIKAYANFSALDNQLLPDVEATLASPLEYGYRTKLTPHFDGPQGWNRKRKRGNDGQAPRFTEVPPIGFMVKGQRKTMDIEDCPIGTEVIRIGMRTERKCVANNLSTYSKGSTILLRETTERVPKSTGKTRADFKETVVVETDHAWDVKGYVTDHKTTIKEYVGDRVLTNLANSFFQNNNSILPVFIEYIRDRIFSKSEGPKPQYLVDAYCGSGLFTITLSDLFKQSIGIDIDAESIRFASKNAQLNNLPESQTKFIASTASDIFKSIKFAAQETVVVIDPPRKGCDQPFLSQLLRFRPQRIVYVSCNVHTQARDVGILVGGMPGVDSGFGDGEGAYTIESLRGCDFFPQTSHVEAVAVLERKSPL